MSSDSMMCLGFTLRCQVSFALLAIMQTSPSCISSVAIYRQDCYSKHYSSHTHSKRFAFTTDIAFKATVTDPRVYIMLLAASN
ncbi:hypothetical protein BDB00DRAFT_850332, partial [Zychaea mexicana]|uniref:uncharacterized protein n=1 Tax=Zychaea mexicana TaxID=64656 RepID=UPI0022FEA306